MGEVTDLRYASALLSWDERVNMPPGGVFTHGEMLGDNQTPRARQIHIRRNAGKLIEQAEAEVRSLDADVPSA